MLLYVFETCSAINRLQRMADELQARFETRQKPALLLRDVKAFEASHDEVAERLPKEVKSENLHRHLYFLKLHLGKGDRDSCKMDARDLARHDVPKLEESFRKWCAADSASDQEFAMKVAPLIERREMDSAVRKAFVILTERIRKKAKVPSTLDGERLVNAALGTEGALAARLADGEREALRNLAAGLYGVFRNRYGHNDVAETRAESEAALSMVNWLLLRLDALPKRRRVVRKPA